MQTNLLGRLGAEFDLFAFASVGRDAPPCERFFDLGAGAGFRQVWSLCEPTAPTPARRL